LLHVVKRNAARCFAAHPTKHSVAPPDAKEYYCAWLRKKRRCCTRPTSPPVGPNFLLSCATASGPHECILFSYARQWIPRVSCLYCARASSLCRARTLLSLRSQPARVVSSLLPVATFLAHGSGLHDCPFFCEGRAASIPKCRSDDGCLGARVSFLKCLFFFLLRGTSAVVLVPHPSYPKLYFPDTRCCGSASFQWLSGRVGRSNGCLLLALSS
jgi:hypothetical protein